jgi:predicted nucleotidyltransferase
MSRILDLHRAELEAVCRRHGVDRLYLFGSAASGTDDPDTSDLDFLVEFRSMPFTAYADAYFGLLESRETLFGRPVDLVVDSAIDNPYFRQSVEESRTSLYAA